jgi:hypothetical protein
VKLIEDNLNQFSFAAYAQLENGDFDKSNAKVLILPQSIAMSKAECDAIRRFVQRGGTVIADCRTALMDEHCKMLGGGQLDDLFGVERKDSEFAPGSPGLAATPAAKKADLPLLDSLPDVRAAETGVTPTAGAVAWYQDSAGTPAMIVKQHGKGRTIYLNADITDYHRWRLKPPEGQPLRDLIGAMLRQGGVQPQYAVATAEAGHPHAVETHPFRCGDLRILALHRNYQLRVSELGPPEYQDQEGLQGPIKLTVPLGARHAVYDQRAGKYLGKVESVTVDLATYEPTVLAILPEPIEKVSVSTARDAQRGELVKVTLKLDGPRIGTTHAFRVDVLAPDGKPMPVLTRTLLAPKGQAVWEFPIAVSDPAGQYTLRVRDVATGVRVEQSLTVR